MTEFENAVTVRVAVMATEERLPPLGIPVNPDRDIGFVSVMARLENPLERKVRLTIERIEIRDASNQLLPDFVFSPRQIELNPLENSEIVFSMTGKTGYAGRERVKAVLVYRVGERRKVIESELARIGD